MTNLHNHSNISPNKKTITILLENIHKTQGQKYTNLGEPIKSYLRKLIQSNTIVLPKICHYEPIVKSSWWNDSDFCEYHRTKGHKTFYCVILKSLIRDLID